MLQDLKLTDLNTRRKHNRLHMMYKINSKLVAINKNKYLQQSDKRTRGAHKFYQPRANHPALYNSFFPRTVKEWNELPPHIVYAPTLENFKAGLDGALLHHQAPRN